MPDQRISVIVPAYNIAQWLGRCLDSLLAQTYEDLEIVVVNDGSTDGTGAVLEAYGAKDPRIKAVHKENGGVTSARLRGVREATGQWLGFVDGDDVVEPGMYERLLENALAYGADISHCGQQVVFPDGRVTKVTSSGEIRRQDRKTGLEDLLDGGLIESGLCTKLYRATLFEGLPAWMDQSIKNNEDLLMNYYLFSRAESSVFEAVCPYHYMLRQGSASYRPPREQIVADQLKVRRILVENAPQELKADAYRALLRNALFLYGWLATNPRREFDGGRAMVRRALQENKAHFPVLSPRNRMLANMICTVPWMFSGAYRVYVALFHREEEH